MNQDAKDLTGYPSVDRPWLKYYNSGVVGEKLPECSIYEYLWENNKDYLADRALRYVNRTIRYKELFDGIDRAAEAFYELGIREGDVVVGITPSFPEVLYSFYGLNKIGAVSDWFDPRTAPIVIAKEMKSTGVKAVLIYEEFIGSFEEMLKGFDCPVIVMSAADSLAAPLKLLAMAKRNRRLPADYLRYGEFIKHYSGGKIVPKGGRASLPAVMEHTGGTTGTPKAVVLTNQNANAVVWQYQMTGVLRRHDSWVSVAFPFTAYALICSQHMPLCTGGLCGLCFSMDTEDIADMMLKGKYNRMAHTPVLWESFIHSPKMKGKDLSFLMSAAVGADSLSHAAEESINAFLREHDCKNDVIKGYGMTEVCATVVTCMSNEINKIGSVGIPFSHTIVSIFDINTGEELPYGKQGEVCITGPSVMQGYFENKEATDAALKKHVDGRIWMHSGDLGYMDEDGFLFIDGRLKRMLIDHHGFKIFAPQVEEVLSGVPGVDKCCVVGVPDKQYGTGQVAVAYILLRKGAEVNEAPLRRACAEKLPEYCMPSKFVFVEDMPLTGVGKVDYRKLEESNK